MNKKLGTVNQTILLSTLKEGLRRSDDAEFQHRLHCLVLVAQGLSSQQVAMLFGKSPRTLDRWIRLYQELGVEGLRSDKKPGRTPKLDWPRLALLRHDLRRSPRDFGLDKDEWDGHLVSHHLLNRYRIELSVRHCQRLLRQLGSEAPGRGHLALPGPLPESRPGAWSLEHMAEPVEQVTAA